MVEADLDSVVAVEAEAHEAPWTRGNFADSFKAGYVATVLCEEEHLQGYSVVMPLPDEAELLNITVAPAAQGRGLGSMLLQALMRDAKSAGALRLFLEVRASNTPARQLYLKSGFVESGCRRGYYACKDGLREDAVLMEKAL